MSRSTISTYCAVHPETKLLCPRCLAALGGKVTSKSKSAAARRNGKLGGRPKNAERGGAKP